MNQSVVICDTDTP